MRELRLVPSALAVWAVALLVLCGYLLVAAIGLLIATAGMVIFNQFGQAILVSALGLVSILVTHVRMQRAPDEITAGKVTMSPTETSSGFLIRLHTEGATYPVFVEDLPDGIDTGSVVEVNARWSESNPRRVAASTAMESGFESPKPLES